MGRLADDLRRHFVHDQVFQDIHSIDPGADCIDALNRGLAECGAVLVVIGPGWLCATDKKGRRRLDSRDDWVRLEIAESLQRPAVRVFPVLVEGAEMPATEDLPEPLRPLARRQAFELTSRHWAQDFASLVEQLKLVPGLDRPASASEMPGLPGSTEGAAPAPMAVPSAGRAPLEPAASIVPSARTAPWRPLAILVAVGAIVIAVILSREWRADPEPPVRPPVVPASGPEPTRPIAEPGTTASPASGKPASSAVSSTASSAAKAESAPAALAVKPGQSFRDCEQCPEMVVVPAGGFVMGSPAAEAGRTDDEGPQHRVTIARAFAAGKYEVTFEEWDACVAAGGCTLRAVDQGWGRSRRPVIGVNWNDSQEYVGWLSKKTAQPYRLLSEAEWEYAARGGTTTAYPWGHEPDRNRANFRDSGSEWSGKQTAPAGSFEPNTFGLHDMIGNVREWVQDCWNPSYVGAPADGSSWESGDCGERALRGTSWDDQIAGGARVASRDHDPPFSRGSSSGLRVARVL